MGARSPHTSRDTSLDVKVQVTATFLKKRRHTCPEVVLSDMLTSVAKVEQKHQQTGPKWTDGGSAKERVEQSLSLILRLYTIYGFNKVGYKLDRSIRCALILMGSFKNQSDPMKWVKTIKYMILSFWRYHMGLDHKIDPDFSVAIDKPCELLRGRAARWSRSTHLQDREGFLNSVLIGLKGGLPRPDEKAVGSELKKWKGKIFCKASVLVEERAVILEYERTCGALEQERIMQKKWEEQVAFVNIRDTLFDFCKKMEILEPSEVLLTPRIPSTSANYINSRAAGGGVATLLNDPAFRSFIASNPLNIGEHKGSPGSKPPDGTNSIYAFPFDSSYVPAYSEGSMVKYMTTAGYVIDTYPIRLNYAKVLLYCYAKSREEEPLVEPVGLSEALKVRVITKCPPYLMFTMNAFMAPLRRELLKYHCFRLTGETIDERILDETFQNVRPINSGDYVGSTDNLELLYSEMCVEVLCDTYYSKCVEYFPGFRELFRKSLYGFMCYELSSVEAQALQYKAELSRRNSFSTEARKRVRIRCRREQIVPDWMRGELLVQRRGQLMGSVASFPVLSLLNMALCLTAMKIGNPKDWRPNLLINGDDCVFEATPKTVQVWEDYGRIMGLSPSPGKCDYSLKRLQMNSRTFAPDAMPLPYDFGYLDSNMEWQPHPSRRWRRIPVLLTALPLGKKRSSTLDLTADETATVFNYPALYEEYVRELVNPGESALHFFQSEFVKAIKKRQLWHPEEKCIPWRVPQTFGGYGLKCSDPLTPTDWNGMKVQIWHDVQFSALCPDKEWLFHDLLMATLRKDFCEEYPGDNDQDLSCLYWHTFINQADRVKASYWKNVSGTQLGNLTGVAGEFLIKKKFCSRRKPEDRSRLALNMAIRSRFWSRVNTYPSISEKTLIRCRGYEKYMWLYGIKERHGWLIEDAFRSSDLHNHFGWSKDIELLILEFLSVPLFLPEVW